MRIIYDDLVEFSEIVIRCTETVKKGKCHYCPFFDRCQIDDRQNRHVQCGEIETKNLLDFERNFIMPKVDLYFYPKNDVDVFSNISRATIHQMEKDHEISQKMLEARNRVDISLTEYEALKDKVNKAESEAGYFKMILEKIKLPLDDENFKPYEIQAEWFKKEMSHYREFIVRFKVMENFDL